MATKITKMQDGTYCVRVWAKHVDCFGKRNTKFKMHINTLAVARKIVQEFELELEQPFGDIKFSTLMDMYLKSKENKMSPTTKVNCKYDYVVIRKYLGEIKAKNINTLIMQQFVDKVSNLKNKNNPQKTLSVGTQKKYVSDVKAIINWAVAHDILEYNKIKRIEFAQEEDEFEPTILPGEKLGEVLAFLKKRFYNLYIPVLLSCTMSNRRGEALGLKWESVSFEDGIIELKNNLLQVGTKVIERAKLKTTSSRRYLVMSEFVKNELLEHKELNKVLNSEYVCANLFLGTVPTPDYVTKKFHFVMKRNFNIDMRLHDLRHCFNQLGYEDDIDLTTRSKMMGHSSTDITNDIYTHFSKNKMAVAMNTISRSIESGFKKAINE